MTNENNVATKKTYSSKRERKKWVVVLCVYLCIVLIIFAYKFCIVRTIESINGYIHQRVCFGTCEICNDNDATHRIINHNYKIYFCDDCWEELGETYLEVLSKQDMDTPNKTSADERDAKICAVKAVEDNLKSPSTAKFCSYSEMTAENLGGNQWRIEGYVDAQNSFGAMIRENWIVTLTLTGEGFTDYSVQVVN